MGELEYKRVVITRPQGQIQELADRIIERGGDVLEYPLIHVEPVDAARIEVLGQAFCALLQSDAQDSCCEAAAPETAKPLCYDGLILTSSTAARMVMERWGKYVEGAERIFVVGEKTALHLPKSGRIEIPASSSSAAVAEHIIAFYESAIQSKRFIFPQAINGRPEIRDILQDAGCVVDALPLYETLSWEGAPPLPNYLRLDWVIFTSPSAVRAFASSNPGRETLRIACIGPTTAKEAENYGFTVDVVPDIQSAEAIVAAIDAC